MYFWNPQKFKTINSLYTKAAKTSIKYSVNLIKNSPTFISLKIKEINSEPKFPKILATA